MGQTLSEPITDKSTNEGNDKRVMYGASCMQGWRTSKFHKKRVSQLTSIHTYI